MTKTIALIAATAASLIVTAVPAAARTGAFDAVTLTRHDGGARYCIRSGWGTAGSYANRMIRRGDCYTEQGWQQRGVAIDRVTGQVAPRAQTIQLAAR
ncbi:hypothetical protein ASE86_00270 [Sphingomonas sp. Leaf33]|uniref:hypothetical protein n=1 Tax=Sphingomonas sp. Leaf33 TaxID=1736215 RepID=UPI0006F22B8F|nr:hypothetical protein [Sphingomonas sp. Leaf33]KQN24777.1 hypothetical protein ASE86_00270 [Sphingomonas sp. Leaf33]